MILSTSNTSGQTRSRLHTAALTLAGFCALLACSASARADDDHHHGHGHGHGHHEGWRHEDRGYYAPPVDYGPRYAYPPPVYYGPSLSVQVPGLYIGVR
jgi:hypothetical protein